MYEYEEMKPSHEINHRIKQNSFSNCTTYLNNRIPPSVNDNVMQRKVTLVDNKRKLYTDEKDPVNEKLIAETAADRSTYVQFYDSSYVTNPQLKDFVNELHGKVESKDFLKYTSLHHNEYYGQAPKESQWAVHRHSYFIINCFFSRLIDLFNPDHARDEEFDDECSYILHWFDGSGDLINEYVGEDAMNSAMVLLTNHTLTTGDNVYKNCYEDISKRLSEMEQEFQFCESVIENGNAHEMLERPKAEGTKQVGLLGNDCGKFAYAISKMLEGTSVGQYSGKEVENYSFHKWVEIAKREDLNGVVSAETCAGQGGLFRTVFSIRPTKEIAHKGTDEIDRKDDVELMKESGNKVHKESEEVVYNPIVMEHYIALLNNLIKKGKGRTDPRVIYYYSKLFNYVYSDYCTNDDIIQEFKIIENKLNRMSFTSKR